MSSQQSPSSSDTPTTDGGVRKRVCKACDRCRMKKSKVKPKPLRLRVTRDSVLILSLVSSATATVPVLDVGQITPYVSLESERKHRTRYVEMLEEQQAQLVTGLQQLYKRVLEGSSWPGSPLKETDGHPLTHDILERLGALKHDGHETEVPFEEDLTVLQQRLLANGAEVMQRRDSSGTSSNSDYSPTFTKNIHGGPFSTSNMPPTPPNYSPYPRPQQMTAQTVVRPGEHRPRIPHQPARISRSQVQASEFLQQRSASHGSKQTLFPSSAAGLPRQPSWDQFPSNELDMTSGLMNGFDPPLSGDAMDYFQRTPAAILQPLPQAALCGLTAQSDWVDDDFQKFLNPSPL
ncbi:Fluconazole resistance protein 1 [Emydomyces testavorans]|uniref:Fluconazole resistance protein 1 n=1 Tax=Emydomyces testavorans TaxID=2070801 RepID=A0AAF0IKE8_9EURO|nr:Fluconazole resistance protein 1 [Emydomyces testavorans]